MVTNEELAERLSAFLDAHHVLSLATVGPNGPHAANLFYARDGFALLWVSDSASQHSIQLEADGRVAATIAMDYSEYAQIRGMQISGRARRITDMAERARARMLLEARYAFLKILAEGSSAVSAAYEQAQFYRLDPTRLVLIDNSRGFGHKETLELGDRTVC
jgi:hypothetical protein